MSWTKHFTVTGASNMVALPSSINHQTGGTSATGSKYSSFLPEVYSGHPNRIQRYYQYDDMDRDSDINAAIDTIADFCTQSEEQNEAPFYFQYHTEVNETEVEILKRFLDKWVMLNNFTGQLWDMFRNTIKNGDSFFVLDPETHQWLWIDHYNVEFVNVDAENGNEPDEYFVRGLEYSREARYATKKVDLGQYKTPFGLNTTQARPVNSGQANGMFQMAGAVRDPRQMRMSQQNSNLFAIDADKVVHLSLNNGMDINWPFGQSILEPIFKTYKQKELLEDSIIIYRVQRAPERRIFYIDVGSASPVMAKAQLEAIKNEIHQRRIPNHTGGGSSIVDAAYSPLCLDMDTRVPLLDGRTLTIKELAEEYRQGKENWVYSCNPITGKILPGNITWAGVTKKNAKVIKLVLDNGETITCTPDHKIPVLGKGFVEAQHLKPEDSLIAFNTRLKNVDRKLKNKATYTQVYDHEDKKWVFAHRMVGEFFRKQGKHQEFTFLPEHANDVKQVIHHKDYDRYNNDPRNLAYMNKRDHVCFHAFNKRDYWDNMPLSERERLSNKISNSLKAYYSSMSEEDKKKFSELSSIRNKAWIREMKIVDPEAFSRWRKKVGRATSKFFTENPEAAFNRAKTRANNGHNVYKNQELNVSQEMVKMIVDLVKTYEPTRISAAERLTAIPEFMEELARVNPPLAGHANKIDYEKISPQKLDLIVTKAGYQGWRDFTRKIAQYNHRVIRIEEIESMEVGTITIDGNEKWHSHHTFATEAGIFVKNSIIEDYFFANTAEGRGSKVETLAGGDNLGEIGDLTFFTNKMARGLRVPSSYLSLGGENAQGATFNDGKLGQAMVEEFRFNKYCMRLQSRLSPTFDAQFKRYVKANGIEIDPEIYTLKFNPPQNFSAYRQMEKDQMQVGIYQMLESNKKLSERFKFKRFLNLTEEEMLENERMWAQENAGKMKQATGATPAETDSGGLEDIGLRPPSGPMPDFSEPDMDIPDDGPGPGPGPGPGADAPPPPDAPV